MIRTPTIWILTSSSTDKAKERHNSSTKVSRTSKPTMLILSVLTTSMVSLNRLTTTRWPGCSYSRTFPTSLRWLCNSKTCWSVNRFGIFNRCRTGKFKSRIRKIPHCYKSNNTIWWIL